MSDCRSKLYHYTSFRRLMAALTMLIVLFLLVFGLPVLVDLPPGLNSKSISIDLNSGCLKHQKSLLWFRISDSIQDTLVSRIHGDSVQEKSHEWRLVFRAPIGCHVSPHFSYHGAEFALSQMDQALVGQKLTLAAKREAVHRFLTKLRNDNSDHAAKEFSERLWQLSFDKEPQARSLDVKDLPD